MIARICGILDGIEKDTAMIRIGIGPAVGSRGYPAVSAGRNPALSPGMVSQNTDRQDGALTYGVLLPAYVVGRLGGAIGQVVTLHTLSYIESQSQGATLFPRLLGFLTRLDQEFFELFTTCKGIGHRRALRVMTMETSLIAGAIADRDVATLQSLPEVGKRTAETIVVTLRDKVDRFIDAHSPTGFNQGAAGQDTPADATGVMAVGPGGDTSGDGVNLAGGGGRLARQALEVLVQLGEPRAEALSWIDQALQQEHATPIRDVQDLVQAVYRLRALR